MTARVKISQNVDVPAKVHLAHLKVEHCQTLRVVLLGAICQSERSTDRAALLEDLLFAQPSIDRATNMFARSTDRAGIWFCAIDRSCRNGKHEIGCLAAAMWEIGAPVVHPAGHCKLSDRGRC